MRNVNKKKLVISLIKDDLINTKLVYGLEAMGFDALHYCLHLSETIFNLMELDGGWNSEPIAEYYYETSKKVKRLDIKNSNKPVDRLANEIYDGLVKLKTRAQKL